MDDGGIAPDGGPLGDGGIAPDGGQLGDGGTAPDGGLNLGRLRGGGCLCNAQPGSSTNALPLFILIVILAGCCRRRALVILLIIVALGWIFLGPITANAAGTPDIQRFRPTSPDSKFLTVESPYLMKRGQLSFGFYTNFADDPLIFYRNGQKTADVVNWQLGFSVVAAAALHDYVQVGIDFPLTLQSGVRADNSGSLSAFGINEPTFHVKIGILDGRRSPLAMAFITKANVPIAKKNQFMGDRVFTITPILAMGKRWKPISIGFNLGYRLRLRGIQTANLNVDDELFYRLGIAIHIKKIRLDIVGEIFGATAAASPFKLESQNPLDAIVSVRYRFPNGLCLTAGGGTGIQPGYGSPLFRILAGISFEPPEKGQRKKTEKRDRDGDGIPDERDRCPDTHGRGSSDGCPKDRDGDKVPDYRDKCPDTPGHGSPDGCPKDRDNDKIPDFRDQCPDQPEDYDGFQDEDGCPDPDNDKDGIPDEKDDCPNDPEDKDGFMDHDGCPDPDNDLDGIPDSRDLCKNKAEDIDGFKDGDGCPDLDNDGDGIPDHKDLCPLKAETLNGYKDEDGCPDKGGTLVKKGKTQLELLRKVRFKYKTARVDSRSIKLLNAVASLLRTHKHIIKCRIDGHTEKIRGWTWKQEVRLTERMARVVKRFLVKKGVDPERVAIMGFGAKNPLVKNGYSSRNRRVEFVIVEQ